MFKPRLFLLALLLSAPLACKPPFNPKIYPTADKLYEVALAEYKARRYDNAAKAFEKLTLDLNVTPHISSNDAVRLEMLDDRSFEDETLRRSTEIKYDH